VAILGQILPIRTNFEKSFDEARRNPDKLTWPLSGRKVPFQDRGSPAIARGPASPLVIFHRLVYHTSAAINVAPDMSDNYFPLVIPLFAKYPEGEGEAIFPWFPPLLRVPYN
jgi:hypothetical protein